MRILKIFIFLLLMSSFSYSFVSPQFGIESTAGSNKLLLFTPWLGLRYSISSNSSFLFKYYNHNVSFSYQVEEGIEKKRNANISNFSLVYYFQKPGSELYSALSFLADSDSYRGIALDCGISKSPLKWLKTEMGFYLLKESSILWYPDEDVRDIFLYSFKGGLKFKIRENLEFNPNFYFYRNSEDVNAYSISAGFIYSPREPLYLFLFYSRYSESAQYRFSGNYLSFGINLYY
jgi:hypothetical protein